MRARDTIRRKKIDILNISCVFVSIQLPIGIEKKKKKKMRHVHNSFSSLLPAIAIIDAAAAAAAINSLSGCLSPFTNCAHRNVYSTTS